MLRSISVWRARVPVLARPVPPITSAAGVRLSNNPAIPTATFYSALQRAALGMVPTKALELPDDFAIDGWGRRIIYVVNPSFTGTNAFTVTVPITMTSSFCTSKRRPAAQSETTMAAYVLMSTGPNGHGGWPRNFSGANIARISSGSVNTDEQTNCHCTATATAKLTVKYSSNICRHWIRAISSTVSMTLWFTERGTISVADRMIRRGRCCKSASHAERRMWSCMSFQPTSVDSISG